MRKIIINSLLFCATLVCLAYLVKKKHINLTPKAIFLYNLIKTLFFILLMCLMYILFNQIQIQCAKKLS